LFFFLKKKLSSYHLNQKKKNQKDYYIPEKALKVEPIIIGDNISQIVVQCASRFLLIDVEK